MHVQDTNVLHQRKRSDVSGAQYSPLSTQHENNWSLFYYDTALGAQLKNSLGIVL
jgi:hypothetical protein